MTDKQANHLRKEAQKTWSLDALLERIVEVCVVSETAQRVMDLTRVEEADIFAVVDAVSKDPALAAEILRLANSPVFGQSRRVKDIRRAVLVVGMQELHTIAAAMSMMASFSTPDALSSELRALSVLSAATARLLAGELGIDGSDAFLAGLLCEIGAMACVAVDAAGYRAIWVTSDGDSLKRAQLEEERYEARSEVIGAHLLVRNRLPRVVADAISGFGPGEGDELSRVTAFARRAAPIITRAANEGDADLFNERMPALAAALGLGEVDMDKLFRICIDAAATAELSLRGEIMLADREAVDGDLSTLDPAAEQILEIAETDSAARKGPAMPRGPASGVRLGLKKR
jgi:HD-like signal output (HDOD) protein